MNVQEIAAAVEAADGVAPFNEATLLALGSGDTPRVMEVTDQSAMIGFDDAPAEFAVHPEHRNQGIGRRVLDDLLARGETTFWAHGDLPAAQALAASTNLHPTRTLLILRTTPADRGAPPTPGDRGAPPTPGDRGAPPTPGDRGASLPPNPLVEVRACEPRNQQKPTSKSTIRPSTPADIDGIIAVNARSFASHPEQGAMDRADFDRRAQSPWFDHAGLFVAERDGQIVGFHWTKIEDGIGEVYVVGVDPSEQGTGLGTALTARGLDHLWAAGVNAIDLYVEADNAPALAVYHRLGFTERARDTLYSTQ